MSRSIKLSTGTVLDVDGAGSCVLGISADLEVTEGYDHTNEQWEGCDWRVDVTPLSVAEKAEVCDVMIDRWSRLKARLLETV